MKAYEDGDAVVLLITKDRGVDDQRIRADVERLRGQPDVAVFTTRASDVADYSRITEGVNVDRAPALVVIRPKRYSDGSMPTATVSYGFRNDESVQQAVDDALYPGRTDLPFYPN